jgi:death-on-curing protein
MSEATSPGEIIFLTLDEVLQIHSHQIETYGGDPGDLDIGKLESAIAAPRQAFGGVFAHPDAASMAAAYLFHITQNHAFVDGNKRTGTHAAIVFLAMNGIDVDYDFAGIVSLTLGIAKGEKTKADAIAYFTELLKEC